MKKLKIGVLFGGKSAEHQISLISAKNVIAILDREKYEIVTIGISKDGQFRLYNNEDFVLEADNPKKVRLGENYSEIVFTNKGIINLKNGEKIELDVVFPVLHGTIGEDGCIQGLLKTYDIPFVGPSVLGSAIGMDKVVMKKLLHDANIPIAEFVSYCASDREKINFNDVSKSLGLPLFIKPANAGSSVGISKVDNEAHFISGINEAFRYDDKILIEEAIKGREIEVSVLGNKNVSASLPGEVIPTHEFYSYEAKYIDENGAQFEIPAKLSAKEIESIKDIAIRTFKALNCEGMSRVDGFLTPNGDFLINEINTIPGFTKISMYPKLWEASGISYSELLDRLLSLAIERSKRERTISDNF